MTGKRVRQRKGNENARKHGEKPRKQKKKTRKKKRRKTEIKSEFRCVRERLGRGVDTRHTTPKNLQSFYAKDSPGNSPLRNHQKTIRCEQNELDQKRGGEVKICPRGGMGTRIKNCQNRKKNFPNESGIVKTENRLTWRSNTRDQYFWTLSCWLFLPVFDFAVRAFTNCATRGGVWWWWSRTSHDVPTCF